MRYPDWPGFGALASLAALAVPVQVAPDVEDRRIVATDARLPAELAEAIGSIVFVDVLLSRTATSQSTLRDGGTGVLISSCLVLTAAHLFGAPGTDESRLRELKVHFPLAARPGGQQPAISARVVGADDRGLQRDPVLDDWVLLRLDAPAPVAPMAIASSGCCTWYSLPRDAAIGGFPVDRLDRARIEMWVDPACRIQMKLANSMLATNCQATSGNSGGPLLVREGGGWRVAGMITRARPPAIDRRISRNVSYAIAMNGRLRTAIATAPARHCPAPPVS